MAAAALLASTGRARAHSAIDAPPVEPRDAPTPICSDRPTKADAACTVPEGRFQAEAWPAQNVDPAETARRYTADVAVAYLLTPTWQADLGGNVGLNRFTPDAHVDPGLPSRF